MLHGFGGTARHWDRVAALLDRERYSPLALELHQAQPLDLSGAIELVARAAPDRFTLCGYSMGGRIALHLALAMPQRVSRLIVISASAGLGDDVQRAARRAADEQLAVEIERAGIEPFIAHWRDTPLFADDPGWAQELIAEDTRRLTAQQIAGTLRAYSAGRLEPLWDRLTSLEMPVVVLAGERDTAYVEIGRRLAASIADGRLEVVTDAGHRLALEAPEAVVAALS
jgi:2-succinyl-6-hydroxy-2,4-cyclohexadiene-1-carboxylate synthase